ncbi:hypothetical protein BJY52DRAFT_1222930 [Lactarius psammicola]|nr:hypothetical protein BJY52DRAFT_1222930 [Lactarius psammicola]
MAKQFSIVGVGSKIAAAVGESLSARQQIALFLRQQLPTINAEVRRLEPGRTDLHSTGNGIVDEDELESLIRRVDFLPVGSEARRAATAKLKWLTSLHWTPLTASSETLMRSDFLANSKLQLDAYHYDFEKIKHRLEVTLKKAIDDLAAGASEADQQKDNACRAFINASETPAHYEYLFQYHPSRKAIKASTLRYEKDISRSINPRTLSRPFQRIASVACAVRPGYGVHRRTYVVSGPSLLAQALRNAGRMDPALLFNDGRDGIDKVGSLPQYPNRTVTNLVHLYDQFPPPSRHLDRCGVIQLSGYLGTRTKGLHIARGFLLPKQLTQNGLSEAHVQLTELALFQTVTHHGTSDASDALVKRSKDGDAGYNPVVEADYLEKNLGLSRYDGEDIFAPD